MSFSKPQLQATVTEQLVVDSFSNLSRGGILITNAFSLLIEALLLPYIDKKIHHLLQVIPNSGTKNSGSHYW